jgi:hypothetical protein
VMTMPRLALRYARYALAALAAVAFGTNLN